MMGFLGSPSYPTTHTLHSTSVNWNNKKNKLCVCVCDIVQELCESRGGRPGLSVLTSLLVSVDVKVY